MSAEDNENEKSIEIEIERIDDSNSAKSSVSSVEQEQVQRIPNIMIDEASPYPSVERLHE